MKGAIKGIVRLFLAKLGDLTIESEVVQAAAMGRTK